MARFNLSKLLADQRGPGMADPTLPPPTADDGLPADVRQDEWMMRCRQVAFRAPTSVPFGYSRRISLTWDIHVNIVNAVRRGIYPHVAASSQGLSKCQVISWLRDGEHEWDIFVQLHDQWAERGCPSDQPEPLPSMKGVFFIDCYQAANLARATAESTVFSTDPKTWLLRGPGRDKAGFEGWTDKIEVTGAKGGPLATTVQQQGADLTKLSDDQLQALESILASATGAESRPGGEGSA